VTEICLIWVPALVFWIVVFLGVLVKFVDYDSAISLPGLKWLVFRLWFILSRKSYALLKLSEEEEYLCHRDFGYIHAFKQRHQESWQDIDSEVTQRIFVRRWGKALSFKNITFLNYNDLAVYLF